MALDFGTNPTFSGRITAPDANYPQGSSKDETAPGANDGMPYVKQRADDILGMQQALLFEASITPSDSADTAIQSDYLDAMKKAFKIGRKNFLINGVPAIAQLGAAFSKAGDSGPYYLYDGWFGSQTGAGVGSEDWLLPIDTLISGQEVPFVGITQNGSPGTTRYCQIIDKESAEGLGGQKATFSVDIAANQATGSTYDLFVTYDTDDSTLNSAAATGTSFESVGSVAGQSLGNAFLTVVTKASLTVDIPDAAQRVAVILKINGATAGHGYRFSGLQLELGRSPSDYEFLPLSAQRALAFERYWDSGTVLHFGWPSNGASFFRNIFESFPVPMLFVPAVTVGGSTTWSVGTITTESFNANVNLGDSTSDTNVNNIIANANL